MSAYAHSLRCPCGMWCRADCPECVCPLGPLPATNGGKKMDPDHAPCDCSF